MIPSRSSLLSEIQSRIAVALNPSLITTSSISDLFEVYILSLVIEAAHIEGASIDYKDVLGKDPQNFVFRTSPGYIFSTTNLYTHAILSFPNKPSLEAHTGIRVTGNSKILHECDVAVVYRDEADICRQSRQFSPRPTKVLLAVECKCYSSSLPLGSARGFIGLVSELSSKGDHYFVFNTQSNSVETLLAHRKNSLKWQSKINPSSPTDVDRLRSLFQDTFKNFKAGR